MPAVVDTVPRPVQRSLIAALTASRHPRIDLPTLAANRGLSLAEAQAIAKAHGYPEQPAMVTALRRLDAAIASEAQTTAARSTSADDLELVSAPLGDVHPDPKNLRDDDRSDVVELADSITRIGLLQPLVVRRDPDHSDRLVLVAGHRRLAAVRHLGWSHVPAVIQPHLRPADVIAAMLIENGQRVDLDPIEEARGLAELKASTKRPDADVGRMIGRSQAYVSNRLALLDLSPAEQARIRAGSMNLADGTAVGRQRAGTHRPNAQGKESAAHLDRHHPLASTVVDLCQVQRGHSKNHPGRVGKIACGQCWEDAIRADERTKIGADQ